MTKKFALVLNILLLASLLPSEAFAQSCSIGTNVNGIAGTGFTNGTIAQSFTACETGLLNSVSAQSGNAATGFNEVVVEIFNGDGVTGTKLLTSGAVQVNANRTVTWNLSGFGLQVVAGQKYTARFTTQRGSPQLAYGTGANSAIDYYSGGRIYYLGNSWNDMFFSANIQTLSAPTLTPADDAVEVARSTETNLLFTRGMEAVSGNITIENVTDASTQTVDVTTLTIDGGEVQMPLATPLLPGKDYSIVIPSGVLRATNGIPFPGIASGEWNFSTSTKPFATLSTTSTDLTNDAVFPFSIEFSDAVTGFELSDLIITNGVASNLVGSGSSYTFDVNPTADGEVIVDLPGDVAEAGASNGNDPTDYTLVYDGTAPSVALNTDASGTIQTSVFDVEVVFSEPVTGFETTDLQVTNAEIVENVSTKDSLFTITLRALSQGQITVDLAAGIADDLAGNTNTAAPAMVDVIFSVDLGTNLLSYYPFDGNANDTVSTGFNGTVTGAVLTTGFDGTQDGAYSFDGSDQIEFGDTPIGSGSFTLAFWVKIPEGLPQNSSHTILGKRAACTEGRLFEINYTNSSTLGHRISVEQRNNVGVSSPSISLSEVGEWMHIAFVKDNDELQSSFYLNGVQQTPVAWTSTYNFENNATLKAGISACNGNGRVRFKGDMDDLYVYGRALTAVEVDLLVPFTLKSQSIALQSDIKAGQALDFTFNKDVIQSSVNTTNITATASSSGSVSINVTPALDGFTVVPVNGWPIDEDVTISINGLLAANGTALSSTDATYSVVSDEDAGMILHYPISGNVNEAIGEISGQNGTVSGALFVEGVDGDDFGALSFDGSNDVVTLGDAPLASESFSMAFWVKLPVDGSTTNSTIILSKRVACTEGKMLNISYLRSGDKVRFTGGARNNASAGSVSTGFDYPVDEWIHVAFVKDNGPKKYRLIINGVLDAEADWTLATVDIENSAPIRLGSSPCVGTDGTQRFRGLLDDLRIYDRVIEPRVLSISPSRSSVNVPVDSEISVSFDRPVDVNSLETSTVMLNDADGTNYAVATAFTNGDSVLTVTPNEDLPKGKTYTLSVDTLSAVIGSDFRPFNTSFSVVQSRLLTYSPYNETANVDSLQKISFKFDGDMDMSTIEDGIKVIGSQHGPVEGSFSMPAADSIVFTPSVAYFPNERITVYVRGKLLDSGGESIENTQAFKFHVKAREFTNATLTYERTTLNTGSTGTNSPRQLIPADMDGDGDLDLIGGDDNPGTLFYFENIGAGNYSTGRIIDSNNGYFDIKVTDYDFDGDQDIITVDRSVSQGVYVYENDGATNFTERRIVQLNSSDSRSIVVADFNKGGNMDIAVASFGSNRLQSFDSDGNQLFSAANSSKVIFIADADWNNDGTLDLISGHFDPGLVARQTGNGAGGFSGASIITSTQVRSVVPIDIDEDGDMDIVYSSQSGNRIGVLRNDGNATFTDVQVGSVLGPHRLDVGDADGDGDFDILYTTAGTGVDVNFHYLENSGSLTLWTSNRLIVNDTYAGTFTQTATYADLDNDGDLDVVATDASGGFYVFENMIIDLNEPPLVTNPIADQTIEEDNADGLTIDVSSVFTDSEGDAFNITATSDNAAVTATMNGTDLELSLVTANFFGQVSITVTADDGNGSNSDVFVLEVTSVNDAPEFTLSATEITVTEDFTTTETLTVTQNQPADEAAPTYSLSPASVSFANVSIDETTGEITVTSIENGFGSEEFTITANDGGSENSTATQVFTLTVSDVNDAPVLENAIADVSINEDPTINGRVVLSTAFTDADGEDLVYSVNIVSGEDLATLSLDAATLNIAPAENAFGTVQVEVTAEDAAGESAVDAFDIVINAVNDAPTFTLDKSAIVIAKNFTETQTVAVVADEIPFGEDSQAVTYSLSPASVTFANVSLDAATGQVAITSIADQFGTQEFTITADDGQTENNTATATFTLEVVDNQAPEVIATVQNTTISEDQAALNIVDVRTLFSDPEGDALTYTVSDDFNGGVVVQLTGSNRKARSTGTTLQVTPTANYNGSGTITISASDANQTATTSFTLTVEAVNDAPTLVGSVENQSATEDVAFELTLPTGLFEDVDGDFITLSTGAKPDWLSLQGTVFSGTPANEDVGTSLVEVIAADGNGGTATATFDIIVSNVNDAPTVVAAVSDITVDEDADASTLDVSGVFADVDAGDVLTVTATTNAATLLTVSLNDGTLVINYNSDDFGTANVTLTATDGAGLSVSDEFAVTVNSVNDAPAFSLSDTELMLEQNFTNSVSIDIEAGFVPQDEAGQAVTYTLTSADADVVTATVDGTTISITAIADAFGDQTFTVTADDGQAANNTFEATLTVSVSRLLSADVEQSFDIYPNPTTDFVKFNTSEILAVKVISVEGKILLEEQVQGVLDVRTLKTGSYFLQVSDGKVVTTQRFIKAN